MPAKQYTVVLSEAERSYLLDMITTGRDSAQKLTRARILLKADQRPDQTAWIDSQISAALEVSRPTVERVRKAFSEEGLERALNRKARARPGNQKFDGSDEAHLTTIACSKAPQGRDRWTLQLLADEMVRLNYVEAISPESVRRLLKKTNLSLG
jgi:transposase